MKAFESVNTFLLKLIDKDFKSLYNVKFFLLDKRVNYNCIIGYMLTISISKRKRECNV